MDDSRLCKSIKQNLENQGIFVSETEVKLLYTSVFSNMEEILDKGDIISIPDFGSFWRKKNGIDSPTFYKPSESILKRINREE